MITFKAIWGHYWQTLKNRPNKKLEYHFPSSIGTKVGIVDISQSTGNRQIRHSGFEGRLTIFVLILTTFYSPKHATIYIGIPIPIIYC